jgi:LytS/YehU family sensor histidine kinase
MNERPLEEGAIRVIGTHANHRYLEQGQKRLKKIEKERRQTQKAALAIDITDKQSAMLFLQTLRPHEAQEIATMVRGGMDPTDIALRDRQKLYEEINGRNRSNNGS